MPNPGGRNARPYGLMQEVTDSAALECGLYDYLKVTQASVITRSVEF